jgi:hypothetical protein
VVTVFSSLYHGLRAAALLVEDGTIKAIPYQA